MYVEELVVPMPHAACLSIDGAKVRRIICSAITQNSTDKDIFSESYFALRFTQFDSEKR